MGGVSRDVGVLVLALIVGVCAAPASAAHPRSWPPATDQGNGQPAQPRPQEGSSSSQKGHRHQTAVEEEEGPAPELTKAEGLIQKQDFASAEPLLEKLVQADPGNYVGWFDLAFVENELGKQADSIAAYRRSVAAKPDVFESNLNLGLQLAKAGQPEAERFLRRATELTPTSHAADGKERAWLSLGHVLEGKAADMSVRPTPIEEAIAAYKEAGTLQPKDAEPHLAAGLLLEKQGKFSDAEQEYQRALALDPKSTDAVTGLANIYMRGRRFPEAESELRKVVAAHPEQAAAHVQLGRVLAAEGKNEEAIAELEAGAKSEPANAALQRDLADLYVSAGKNEQAQAAYKRLLGEHPNDAELHDSLGQSLLRQKKFAEAQQEFLTAVRLKPDFGSAYGDLAFAAGENKDYVLAVKALDARSKLLPEIPITYFLRASAYDHLKDVKKAAANYHLFLQAANGKYPEQEWQAKHRLIALEPNR